MLAYSSFQTLKAYPYSCLPIFPQIMMIEIVICAWMYPNIKLMTVVVKEFLLSLNATREDLYFVDEGVQVVAGITMKSI